MAILTRNQILEAKDIVKKEVEVPEWGGSVYIKQMTGKERDALESSLIRYDKNEPKPNHNNARAKFVSYVIVDEDGNRLFSEADIEALGAKNANALDRVYGEAQTFNAISDEDIEELKKNS